MLQTATILTVRLGMIFSVLRLVTHDTTASTVDINPQCTHTYDHISQLLNSQADASLFTTDTSTQCAFNIIPSNLETESVEDINGRNSPE